MMPGNFLVLHIWVGSLFSMRVSAAFQIYFKCKSNNTNEWGVEHFPRPHHSRAACVALPVGGACLEKAGGLDPWLGFPGTHLSWRKAGSAAWAADTDSQAPAVAAGWLTWVQAWSKSKGWLSRPIPAADGWWCMKRERCDLRAAWKSDLESHFLSHRLLTSAFSV